VFASERCLIVSGFLMSKATRAPTLTGIIDEMHTLMHAINSHIRRLRCLPMLRSACLVVTNKCNGRCIMCDIWKTYRDKPGLVKEELSLSEIRDFFSDKDFFKDLGFVYLSGGEPFLRADLPDIVSCIHGCKPTCTVYVATNGFLTDRIVDATREILTFHPRLQIGVSLDGINEIHDKIRGMKGAFEMAHKTLFALRENFPNLHIQVTMTVTPINLRHIPYVYDFCRKNGKFFPRIGLASVASYFKNLGKEFTYSKADIKALKTYFDVIRRDLIQEHGKFHSLSELFWLDGSIKFLMDPTTRLVPCYAGSVSFYMDPYGTVYPCYNFPEEMGSIRNEKIRDIWFSKRSQEIRKRILGKQCPNCWIVHEAASNISSDYFNKFRYLLKRY
jgi:MoaA/NifB/PqqE/SkfB family radical SAM enzyme